SGGFRPTSRESQHQVPASRTAVASGTLLHQYGSLSDGLEFCLRSSQRDAFSAYNERKRDAGKRLWCCHGSPPLDRATSRSFMIGFRLGGRTELREPNSATQPYLRSL